MWLIKQMRLRIRYKIIGPFMLLALCTVVLGSAIAFSLIANSWQERLINQLAVATRIASDTMVELEMTNLQFLRVLVFSSANAATGAPAVSDALAHRDLPGLQQALEPFFLAGVLDVNVHLDRLMIFDAAGHVLVDMEHTPETDSSAHPYVLRSDLDLSQVPIVQRILSGQENGQDDKAAGLVGFSDREKGLQVYLCTVVPVRQPGKSRIVGGAIIAMKLDTLLTVLRKRSQAAIVTVYDMSGVPLASTAFQQLSTSPTLDNKDFPLPVEEQDAPVASTREALQIHSADLTQIQAQVGLDENAQPIVTTISIDGRDYQFLYTYLVIQNTRVGILSTALSNDYVVRGWGDTRLPMLGATLLVMFSITGMGLLVARQVSSPLEQLVSAVNTFVAGGLKQSPDETGLEKSGTLLRDEIEILSSSFRRLSRNQQELLRKVLHESSQRAAILESIPDGIVVCDSTGVIQSLNPAMHQLLGPTCSTASLHSFGDLPLRSVTDPLFGSRHTDLYMLGDAIVRVFKSPIIMPDNTCIGDVYVVQDMTAEANIDQARTAFTATISHEMRTPLTVVHGHIQVLLQGMAGTLNPHQQQLTETIYRHTSTLTRFLSNVITIAELDSGSLHPDPQPVDLKTAIEQVVQPLVRVISDKGLAFTVDIAPDLPAVCVDIYTLKLIIKHLLDNAHTYTETGGITIRATQRAECVQIDVEDTGCGIPSTLIDQVFERFVRGEGDESNTRAARGSGLGLTIVKQLVEKQGGHIWLASEPGQGVTVSFTLPLCSALTTPANPPALPQPSAPVGHVADTLTDSLPLPSIAGNDGHQPNEPPLAPVPGNGHISVEHPHPETAETRRSEAYPLPLPTLMTFVVEILGRNTKAIHNIRQSLHTAGLLPGDFHEMLPEMIGHSLAQLPAPMFQQVLLDILPLMHQRWQARKHCLSPVLTRAYERFSAVLLLESSELEGVLRRVGMLPDHAEQGVEGRITALLDLASRLPWALWFEETRFACEDALIWERVLDALQPDMLLICGQHIPDASMLERLASLGIDVIVKVSQHLSYQVNDVIYRAEQACDQIVLLSNGSQISKKPMRLIEIQFEGQWERYLTSLTDPEQMTIEHVRTLCNPYNYIDRAFHIVHRLILSEHGNLPGDTWTNASNGVQVQVWTLWVLYAILVDLADTVDEVLHQPFDTLSPQPIYPLLPDVPQDQQGDINVGSGMVHSPHPSDAVQITLSAQRQGRG